MAIVAPWWGASKAGHKLNGSSRIRSLPLALPPPSLTIPHCSYIIPIAISFYSWIILMIVGGVVGGYISYIGWAILFGMFAVLCGTSPVPASLRQGSRRGRGD